MPTKLFNQHFDGRVALLLGTVLISTLTIASYILFQASLDDYYKLRFAKQGDLIRQANTYVGNTLGWITKDISYLQQSTSRQLADLDNTEQLQQRIAAEYQAFMQSRARVYGQLRLLDTQGRELLRIFQNTDGIPQTSNELQDKSRRYYFTQAQRLTANDVYVSPLDLNVEHGEIEMPFNPVMRFITPVLNGSGETYGYLVVNVSFKPYLDSLLELAESFHKRLWIFNDEGYWLLSDDEAQPWGFMLPERDAMQLPRQQPELWQLIRQRTDNDVLSEVLHEIPYSYNRLDLSTQNPLDKTLSLLTDDKHWYVVASTREAHIEETLEAVKKRHVFIYLNLLVLFIALSLWVAWSVRKKNIAHSMLQESEQQLRDYLDHAPDSLIICSTDGLIKYVNSHVKTDFGYQDNELIDQPIEMLVPPQLRDTHVNNRQQYVAAPRMRQMGEGMKLFALHKDGHQFPVKISLNTITSSSGDFVISTVRDISSEVALENNKREQEQLLIQQSKLAAMGEMIGAIAHQWRQPLAAVGGALMNIKDAHEFDDLSEEYLDKQVEISQKNIAYMSGTIDDFRNFFSPGKSKTDFCIITATRDTLTLIESQLIASQIAITLNTDHQGVIESYQGTIRDFSSTHEFMTYGYKNEFVQVMLNLISNARAAIKARIDSDQLEADAGAILIRLAKNDQCLMVQIEDNGGGIPADVIDKIFEPYYTTKEQDKGTGIGLYMSKMIIENNMQGTLAAANTEQGAIFTITLQAQAGQLRET